MISTFLSLATLWAVILTMCGTTIDRKVAINHASPQFWTNLLDTANYVDLYCI